MRTAFSMAATLLVAVSLAGQTITLPPNGDNQRSAVIQNIGPVQIRIDYSSPDVHAPNGDDRRGKIWGQLVAYGLADLGFGTCKECPWRAGANENTVFTTSHDLEVEGQRLKAGAYGLHMIAGPDEWTVIFSNNSTSWGSFFYDPAEDALRVKVKPAKWNYTEWLTYEFIDRRPDGAIVALRWEDLQVPIKVAVPNITDLYLAQIHKDLRSSPGFMWQSWNAAARYALTNQRLDDAQEFAQAAISRFGVGQANYFTLNTLADVQEARGLIREASETRVKMVEAANAPQLHQYGRQLLQNGKKAEAIRIWELNARRHPNAWPVHVGLARAYSAAGNYKEALKHAKQALPQAPDDMNKRALADAIKKLEAGQDMNS